jgi:hypothetical protein
MSRTLGRLLASVALLILVLLWVTALSCVGQAMEQGWGF